MLPYFILTGPQVSLYVFVLFTEIDFEDYDRNVDFESIVYMLLFAFRYYTYRLVWESSLHLVYILWSLARFEIMSE